MTAVIALDSGMTIDAKKRAVPQPSISAASCSSFGIVLTKNERTIIMLYTDVPPSSTSIVRVLVRCRLRTIR